MKKKNNDGIRKWLKAMKRQCKKLRQQIAELEKNAGQLDVLERYLENVELCLATEQKILGEEKPKMVSVEV